MIAVNCAMHEPRPLQQVLSLAQMLPPIILINSMPRIRDTPHAAIDLWLIGWRRKLLTDLHL